MKKSVVAIAVASLCSSISAVQAEVTQSQASNSSEVMVVTANRFESKVSDTTAPIIVITKDDIDAIQAISLAEVLQRLPGIQIVNGGGYGKSTEIYVRGTSSRHQLFLVDGMRIGSATLGSTEISSIALSGIQRIEYIRGPRASVYGSDAIGGVINIITSAKSFQKDELSAGMGSNGYYQGKISKSVQLTEDNWGSVVISTQGNEGFSTLPEPYEQDRDGFKSNDVTVEFDSKLTDLLNLKVLGSYHDGESEYDSGSFAAPTYTVWENSIGRKSATANYNIATKLELQKQAYKSELSLAMNQDKSRETSDTGYDSLFKTERQLVNWINSYNVNQDWIVSGGYEWLNELVATNGDSYTIDSRTNNAFYIHSQYVYQDWLLEASGRTDDSDAFGRENTWQLGAAYEFMPELTWSVNSGTAFKAPTFNDLYYPKDSYGNAGNPNVLPETSKHIESSLFGSVAAVDWRITAYHTKIDNLISWVYDSATYSSSPDNVNEAEIKGTEIELSFYTGPVSHMLSYDYTDAKDVESGNYLQRRAKNSAKWNMSYSLSDWQFDLSALYRGKSFDDTNNTNELDPYALVDFAVSYYVWDDLVLRGKITNLFDNNYVNRLDYYNNAYNNAAREYYLTANYQF